MTSAPAIRWDEVPEPAEFFKGEPEHPLLPLPNKRQIAGILQTQGAEGLRQVLKMRREQIRIGQQNPLKAPRPKVWKIAMRLLARAWLKILILLGGNRSTKSYFCADLIMRAILRAVEYNKTHQSDQPTLFLIGSDSEVNSQQTTQALIWHFLPPEWKAMNQLRTQREKRAGIDINYTPGDGFADRSLSLGYGVVVRFILYSNDPANFEGSEFGAKDYRDVAWWMDEGLTLTWLNMLRRRGRFRPGFGLWSYTPIYGMTPAIKDTVGSGKVERSRRAELLPDDQTLVKGVAKGRVPFIQRGATEDVVIIYYHSDLTPFSSGGKRYRDAVKEACAGKPTDFVLRVFYGYTEDTVGRAFPAFTSRVHVVPETSLPDRGTNYVFIDPAGSRNWFIVWVRVAPGDPRRIFIYREWPDILRFGEWAIASERAVTKDSHKGWDGDRGPGQTRNLGWGPNQYKRCMIEEETISPTLAADGTWSERDPYRRLILDHAVAQALKAKEIRRWSKGDVDQFRQLRPRPLREVMALRKIDPRAGKNPAAGDDGGTNLIELFANDHGDGEFGKPMDIIPAYTGRGIDDGYAHVNELLQWKQDQPVCSIINEPKLYVSERCKNIIWMFENYTGHGGEEGGAKDPADLVRYISQDLELIHLTPDALRSRPGYAY